jgi:pimeloyl-ACP methyl ester carboxylesterase
MDPTVHSEDGEGQPSPGSVALPIHWEVHGEKGSPILLLHGFGTNAFTWARWIAELAREHRVFVVEMKGFGASPKPRDGRYGPHDQALLLHHLILQLDLRDLTLVGHSLGGAVVLLTILRLFEEDPGRVRGLVLIAAPVSPQPISPFIRLAGRPLIGPLLVHVLPARFLVRTALKWAYFDSAAVSEAHVEAYADPLRNRDGRYALCLSARQLVPDDFEGVPDRLRRLTIPTLLVWGEEDPIVPLSSGRRAEGILPNALLEVLPECGHAPQEERPQEALDLVLRFLKEGV